MVRRLRVTSSSGRWTNLSMMLATTMPVFPLMAACTACWPKKPQYSLSLALAGTERIM